MSQRNQSAAGQQPPCADLGHELGHGQTKDHAVRADGMGWIGVLVEQAQQDETLIRQIGEAVRKNDRDKVFELAKELTNVHPSA